MQVAGQLPSRGDRRPPQRAQRQTRGRRRRRVGSRNTICNEYRRLYTRYIDNRARATEAGRRVDTLSVQRQLSCRHQRALLTTGCSRVIGGPLSTQSTITQRRPERRRLKSSDSTARVVPLRDRFRPPERPFASTAVDAASMRTSYPRSHTDVVLGGAADSAVLSMLSRSTSRVRCSRALHSVVLGCSRALHVASGHSCLHTCAQWWSEREEGPRYH